MNREEQYAIYRKYLGDFDVGVPMLSPLMEDSNASFCVYDNGKELKWSDFRIATAKNVTEFVVYYHNYVLGEEINYFKAKGIIDNLDLTIVPVVTKKQKKDFEVIPRRSYKDFELEYFAERGVTKDLLLRDWTFGLETFKVSGFNLGGSTKEDPAFVYLYKDIEGKLIEGVYKVYRPYNKKYKWTTININKAEFETLPQLKYNKLVVLSSRKDKQVFATLGLPYDTTNILAEGIYKNFVNSKLLDRYTEKFALLDFDSGEDTPNKDGKITLKGVERTKELEAFGFKGLYLPEDVRKKLVKNGVKDIDECVIKFGKDFTRRIIYTLNNEKT